MHWDTIYAKYKFRKRSSNYSRSLVHQVLENVLEVAKKKRFKDTLKVSLKRCGFDHNAWEELASDHPTWRSKVRSGVTDYEKERIQNAMEKRRLLKERAHKPPSPGQQLHPCPHCSRLFRAPIGLRNHLMTHHAWSCSFSFVKKKKEIASSWCNLHHTVSMLAIKVFLLYLNRDHKVASAYSITLAFMSNEKDRAWHTTHQSPLQKKYVQKNMTHHLTT